MTSRIRNFFWSTVLLSFAAVVSTPVVFVQVGCAADVDVAWTDLVGSSASGNDLTKTAGSGWGNGGAASSKGYSGDFGIEFTSGQNNSNWICGLSQTNIDASWETVDFGIFLKYNATIEVYESGTFRNSFGSFSAGDMFQIERAGTTIVYKKNGTTFYTSGLTSTGTLMVDAAMYYTGRPISDAKFTGVATAAPDAVGDLSGLHGDGEVVLNWSAPSANGSAITGYDIQYGTVTSGTFNMIFSDDATPGATISGLTNGTAYQFRVVATNGIGTGEPSNVAQITPNYGIPVVWTDRIGVTTIGGSLTNVSGAGWGSSGAASSEKQSGDFSIEFAASETNSHRMCGLSDTNADANYTSINYAIYMGTSSILYVYENGTSRGSFGTYQTGDILAIERSGSTIAYKKNGAIFYTSTVASSGDLLVDAALYSLNATVSSVMFFGPAVREPGAPLALGSEVSSGEVVLTWESPSDNGSAITGFEVQYGTVTSGTFNMTYSDDATPGATISGLTDGTAYQFRVVATNALGTSLPSNTVQATPNIGIPVVWTNRVGVSASGNSLTKTGSNNVWNSGAASSEKQSGDFSIQFVASETNTHRMCGLSDADTDVNYTTIDYAIYLAPGAVLYVYENGTSRGTFGSYQTGDKLSVERSGTTITYKKNGTVFYTSTISSSGDLLVDTSLYSTGATITDALFYGLAVSEPGAPLSLGADAADGEVALTWEAPSENGSAITGYEVQYGTLASGTFNLTYTDDASPGATISGLTNGTGYQFRVVATNAIGTSLPSNTVQAAPNIGISVVWTDKVGVSASGNSLTKTASNGIWNSGAASSETQSGDFYIQFVAGETTTHRMCGLSDTNTDVDYSTIDYAVYLAPSGVLYVYENGTSRGTFGTYQTGDKLKVAREGSIVTYQKNGVVFYTSTVASSGDLLVDASLYSAGATINNVMFFGPAAREPGNPLALAAASGDGEVVLTWEAPSDNGSAITEYEVQYGTVTSGIFNLSFIDDATPGVTISGLTNGTAYHFRVVATNALGTSAPSNSVQSVPEVTEDVVWTDLVGVSATGNTITKTAGAGWGNGGAASLSSYGGSFTLTFDNNSSNTNVLCGLSQSNTNASWETIDYAIYLKSGGAVEIYESGTLRGSFQTYAPGDHFSVMRLGSTISYLKNDAVFYTSLVASSGNLLVDATLYYTGAAIVNARITSITTSPPEAIDDLAATAAENAVSLTWSAPADNNSAITGYEVQYGPVTSGTFGVSMTQGSTTGADISGLINDIEYQFRVFAVNASGNGPASNTATATPEKSSVPAEIISPTPGTTLSNAITTFAWSSGQNVNAYKITIDDTTAGGTNVLNSGQISGLAYGASGLPINGSTLYVRLSSLIDGSWVDTDYTFATSSNPIVSFWGAGAGLKSYVGANFYQTVAYCLETQFDVVTANPIDGETVITYDLVDKTGYILMNATATEFLEPSYYTQYIYNQLNEIDYDDTSGTYVINKSNSTDREINFDLDILGSNLKPTSVSYASYTGGQLLPRVTIPYTNWDYPFNLGYIDHNYVVGSSQGQSGCSMEVDVLGVEGSVLPGDEVRLFGIVPVFCDDRLDWEVIPQKDSTARGVITADDERGTTATLSDITGKGELVVRVTNPSIPGCQRDILIMVGCQNCGSASGGQGGGQVCLLTMRPDLKSIDVTWDLGRSGRGVPTGYVRLKTDTTDPANATPAMLDVKAFGSSTQVKYDGENLRQIVANEVLVDIDMIDQYTYDIHYYDVSVDGTMSGGFFVPDVAAVPLKSWRVENPDASPSVYNRLRITETAGMDSTVHEYEWDSGAGEWSLDSGSGLQVITSGESVVGATRTVTNTVEDGSSNVASVTQVTWMDIPGHGEEMTVMVEDPAGDALTTIYSYYDDSGIPEKYGRIESITNPDGSWVKYDYDSLGRMSIEVTSWLDESVSAAPADARAVYYDYTAQDAADTQLTQDSRRPRKVTETWLGEVVSETFYVYSEAADGTRTVISERAGSQGSSYGDSGNLRTTSVYYAYDGSAAGGRVQSVTYPDGRMDTYTYTYGTYTPDMDPSVPGTFSSASGTDELHYITHGTTASPAGIANKSTRQLTIVNKEGEELLNTTEAYDGTNYYAINWKLSYYNSFGHVTDQYRHDGTNVENVWDCCTLDSTTDRVGIENSYTYDDLKRVLTITKDAGTDVVTTYTYDAAGRRLTETVTSGTLSLDSATAYDLTGRIEMSTDQGGLETDYTYSANNRITTVTRPDSATEISEQFVDGRAKSVTGTGVVAQYFTYGVNTDGTQWTQINVGGSSSPNFVKTTTDLLGRTIKEERPGYSGTETTQYFYNNDGRLIRVAATGQADVLYEYDALGNQVRSGLDVNDNGSLALASTDRITDQDTSFVYLSPDWWQQTVQKVYATDNNATPTTVSTQLVRLTGLGSGLVAESRVTDVHGNVTTATTGIDRASRTETRTVDYPDSDADAISVSVNGLLISETGKTGLPATFGYDTLERRVEVQDPRTGSAYTGYDSSTGWVDYVQDAAGNRTYFTFNGTTGRKAAETDALGNKTYFDYNDLGQVTRVWGDVPYPVEYVYDSYGRLTDMHTYRNSAAWSGSTWPSVSGQEDVTTWNYQEATGLLTSKTDDAGESVSYTYTTGGRLATRTWARGGGSIVTTYGYDPYTTELTSIDYSDTTQDVTFTYDRLGRLKTVLDVFLRNYSYNTALQLTTETFADGILTRSYETTGVVGRPAGINIHTDYIVDYGYDSKGRLSTVTSQINSQTPTVYTYSYLANSDLVESLTSDTGLATAYTYEPNRNLRTEVDNEFSSTGISTYEYSYDELGRRSWVKNSGTAFAAAAFNHFQYNPRSELEESARYLGTDETILTNPVTAEFRDYLYDPIGNRTDITVGTNAGDYTANNLNQYTDENTPSGGSNDFTYDEDGNLVQIDGDRNVQYTYDAENRLIAVEPSTTPVVGDVKLEYFYDYMGRRTQKNHLTWNGTNFGWGYFTTYVYDGWNVIKENIHDSGEIRYYHVWGMDLSQSLQGAGGIGGLLTQVDIGAVKSYAYLYDGNGNVGQLIDNSDGSIDAHYEYDPYGNSILASGVAASGNPYRFSTKYLDSEYNLYYYGHRYYDPETGRWLNRDPIEEVGGVNLYAVTGNDFINGWDFLGQWVHPDGIISGSTAVTAVRTSEELELARLNSKLRDVHIIIGSRAKYIASQKRKSLRRLLVTLSRKYDTRVIDGANTSGPGNRWIFTCKYGWIDLGHFFNTSLIAHGFGSNLAYDSSIGMEMFQDLDREYGITGIYSNGQSAGTIEDLNSNFQGSLFLPNFGDVANSFSDFVEDAGTIEITSESIRKILRKDALEFLDDDKVTYIGPRVIKSRREQLRIQKNREAYQCLCDGGKPK